ncbi:DMT family transporter [Streptomyces flavofungini]|uniref:DMT family transporter n=1 Tax=Streptomyces flavofungini TaxID=68200 RepID=A0ABS0XH62_9ACTN|nr:DMT family transporter [Streptomyces flavofungini]MBJ3812550.1 DMT family transporter [Streptomyces flavofungini]GHC88962.1 membrane protein [Streptomyces flavofungini]
MSALALSIVLSLISAVAYAGGAIIQEQVAAKSAAQQYAPLRNGAWWIAVVLNGLGGLLHVVALAYGPLSLVQPLGALTIVFALPMAALFVRRKAGSTAWRGAIMATVGLVGLLSLTQATASQSLADTERIGLALGTAGAVVTLMLLAHAVHRHPAVRGMLLATAAGIAFGISSVFTKTVAVDWDAHEPLTRQVPSLAVIAVLAVSGLLLSQASYRGAGLAAPLSAVTVVNPVIAAGVGLTLFGESFRYGTAGTAVALACGVVAAGGLILLTTERIGAPHQSETPAAASERPLGTGTGTQLLDRPLDSTNGADSADSTDNTSSPSPAAARTADDTQVTEQRRPGHDERPLTEPGRRPLTGEQPAPEQHLVPEPLTAMPLQPASMTTTFPRTSLPRPAREQHSVS